ncbi:malonic semialdehyde reductase [Amycolatopsis sp. NPDC051903]|uniref:malonic semialdehyde reductase n=1 Tax=Amycolatopsis sp. NPDC051903 TaxID=3363936 RepID=UPI0037934913
MTGDIETEPNARLELAEDAQELLFRSARTPNTFTDEPVHDEHLEAIYDLFRFAPTSMNQQPLRILVLRSSAARARLDPYLAEGNRPKTAMAPAVAILAADLEFHEHLPKIFPHRPNAGDAYADRAVRENSARFNATLQIGYFILAVRAAGLAAGPMIGFDAAGVDREFFADGRLTSLVVVNIGRPGPNAWFPRLPRLSYDEVVTVI